MTYMHQPCNVAEDTVPRTCLLFYANQLHPQSQDELRADPQPQPLPNREPFPQKLESRIIQISHSQPLSLPLLPKIPLQPHPLLPLKRSSNNIQLQPFPKIPDESRPQPQPQFDEHKSLILSASIYFYMLYLMQGGMSMFPWNVRRLRLIIFCTIYG